MKLILFSTIQFGELADYLQKYQDPKQADSMTKIQSELDETKIILVINNFTDLFQEFLSAVVMLTNITKFLHYWFKMTEIWCSVRCDLLISNYILTVWYHWKDIGKRGKAEWFSGKVWRIKHAVQSILQDSKFKKDTILYHSRIYVQCIEYSI